MIDTQQGLTATDLLKNPAHHDPRIEELRRLHEEMDRAVLAAYGWTDIPVPAYGTPTTDTERKALEVFKDEVIDRLFVLNAESAEEEDKAALSLDQQKKARGKRRRETPAREEAQGDRGHGRGPGQPVLKKRSPGSSACSSMPDCSGSPPSLGSSPARPATSSAFQGASPFRQVASPPGTMAFLRQDVTPFRVL